jgi:glycosyltransferase involved in cell wall biosynthesis
MGLTALEAMSTGIAVIITNIGGASSFAKHEENALLIDASDERQCRESLFRLIEDHDLRKKLQTNGLRSTQQYYPEKVAFNILKSLFSGRKE